MALSYRIIATSILETGLIIAWSSGFIGGTLASKTSSIFLVLFWRFLLAALLLTPLALPQLRRMTRRDIKLQALIGSFAMFGYLATMIAAIDIGVSPGVAALIAALQPLATAALSGGILGERVVPKQWIGLAVGLLGVAVSVIGGFKQTPLTGYALALVSMACIVTATLIAKAKTGTAPILPALTVQCTVTALLFLPLAAFDGGLAPEITFTFGYAVTWFILFSTFGAYGLYWANLKRTSATRVSSLIYLTPPVTAVWAYKMFDEPITMPVVVGFLLCLVGVGLARNGTYRHKTLLMHQD
ncbi:DMT family transporter [Desulfobulbus rhabdoformis]|uniref:DMT family transporter n=1 Tax=Desulfobulbus rhabdoformis TaxID=34032 RepID=UPI0019628597|nr:DMT family transporter [Desulfobulbus rhabdoformis]MBM9616866.1 DMT family transporter [Desulfobulbus rhabdoformis]